MFIQKASLNSFGMTVPSDKNGSNKREVLFGYKNQLKTLFKKGKLPSVQFDLLGCKLTKKNVTLDHVIPHSKGGPSVTNNFMLATADFNQERGIRPLSDFFIDGNLKRYLDQFIDVRVDSFVGNDYIKGLLETLEKARELGM